MLLFLLSALSLQTGNVDSARVLRDARGAQARFERIRRDHMPIYHGGYASHCDVQIGTLCFTADDREETWDPPPDPEPVVGARGELLDALAAAARQVPGDRWILGQRVRYLVEDGRLAEAATVARGCSAREPWWCHALLGFALHWAGDFLEADREFGTALALMPREQRCKWSDLSLLLDGSRTRGEYRRRGCEDRDSLAARFWWMSDPLYLLAGNERRTEHFSRWVINELQEGALSRTHDLWNADRRESLIRLGWPAAWSRRESRSPAVSAVPDIVAHHRIPLRTFEPPGELLDRPEEPSADWDLRPAQPTSIYLPGYARRFDSLPSQVARFHRGDSVVVVAGFHLSHDSLPPQSSARNGLFFTTGPDHLHGKVTEAGRPRGVLALPVPTRPGVLSVEVLAAGERHAGRERRWMNPPPAPDPVGVSDILVLDRPDSLPRDLAAAIPLARPGTNVPPQSALGLFWEVYLRRPGGYSTSLTVVKEGRGFIGRVVRVLGLGSSEKPRLSLAWEAAARAPVTPAALSVDLTGQDPGRYTIRLTIRTADRDSAVTERVITLTP